MPKGVRIYAVGDIHGRADLLDNVLAKVDLHRSEFPISRSVEIFLGDYIDRGPASRQVIDRLISRSEERATICLRGNHETFITRFIEDSQVLTDWQHLGGLETLTSYGLSPRINAAPAQRTALSSALADVMPGTHRNFFSNLRLSFTCGDFFFAHAGVRPGIALADQVEDDLLWIRNDFLSCEHDFGKIVVHGHTPVQRPEFHTNRINIDTGAYATGRLTCLILDGDRVQLLE